MYERKVFEVALKSYLSKMRGGPRTLAKKPFSEIAWAWIGGFAGIFSVWWLNRWMGIQENPNLFLIGSFGASAVLIYGADNSMSRRDAYLVVTLSWIVFSFFGTLLTLMHRLWCGIRFLQCIGWIVRRSEVRA